MNPNITAFFDQAYVINLVQRKDRRREMEYQLKKIGFQLLDRKVHFSPAVRPQTKAGFPSIGARGCFLSHMNILADATQKGYRRVLICEDDLNFVSDFNSRIGRVLTALSELSWGVFYGGHRGVNLTRSGDQCVLPVAPTQAIGTAHFIAFQNESIALASHYLRSMLDRSPGDPRGGPMHVDGAYNWFRRDNPASNTLLANPELGYQRPSRSDISDLAWYDRLPIISTGVSYSRTLRSHLKRHYL
jgi:glycosyl transferase, family 25